MRMCLLMPEIKQTEYKGETLHYAGLNMPPLWGDFKGRLMHLKALS